MASREIEEILAEPELQQVLLRTQWTPAQAHLILRAVERSGLSLYAFCRRVGIPSGRLYPWRHCLEPQKSRPRRAKPPHSIEASAESRLEPEPAALPVPFVSLRGLVPAQSPAREELPGVCAELVHPRGWRLRLTDQTPEAWLPLLCQAMGGSC